MTRDNLYSVPYCNSVPYYCSMNSEYMYARRVDPLLKDSPNKGDTIEITSLQRTLCKASEIDFPIVPILFVPLKSGQPPYSGQITWSQLVLYKEVPLYVH